VAGGYEQVERERARRNGGGGARRGGGIAWASPCLSPLSLPSPPPSPASVNLHARTHPRVSEASDSCTRAHARVHS